MNSRIDKYLQTQFPKLTRRQIEEALEGGLVQGAGGKRLSKGDRSFDPAELNVNPLRQHLLKIAAGNPAMALTQVEEYPQFCVVDKPAGVPSHPLSLFDFETVSHWALAKFPEIRAEFPECQPTVTPHRLDTGTSGVLVVAKTQKTFAEWRELFAAKEITKKYLAWCWGNPAQDEFEVSNRLAHDNADARKMRGGEEGDRGLRPPFLPAHSSLRVLARAEGKFLVGVECSSGVTHQVRVHCAELGFPLLGDSLYDPEFANRALKPPAHELRALSIAGPGFSFAVPDTEFRKKYAGNP